MAQSLAYDDRLEHLLATAARVFAEQGYHSTAMRDLSRATGMSLAGMYHYVQGKDELLFLIQERCFSQVLEGAVRTLARTEGREPEERLNAFIRHHVLFFTRHMSEMKVLSHEAESLSDERIGNINRLKKRYVNLLIGLIKDLDGLPRRIDPRVAAYALFGMMNWIYTWYDPQGSVSPEALARQFTRIFMGGVVRETGIPVG